MLDDRLRCERIDASEAAEVEASGGFSKELICRLESAEAGRRKLRQGEALPLGGATQTQRRVVFFGAGQAFVKDSSARNSGESSSISLDDAVRLPRVVRTTARRPHRVRG